MAERRRLVPLRPRRLTPVRSAWVVVLLLGGCTAEPRVSADASSTAVRSAADDARAAGFSEQHEVLRDGVVTKAEYEEAMEHVLTCIRGHGYMASDPVTSPVDGLALLFHQDPNGHPAAAFNAGTHECKTRYNSFVEGMYVSTNPARMDEPLRQGVIECLRGAAFDVDGDEVNAKQFVQAVGGEHQERVVDCIAEAAGPLYPELPMLFVTALE